MKTFTPGILILALVGLACHVHAASTINTTNKWAWAANSGWLSGHTDSTNGIIIGEYTCSGYFWSVATGWIHVGNGSPTNGIRYTNVSSNDYGVNHDGKGSLRGFAWSATVGWINFETNGNPRVDFKTGILHGYAWGGSLGWISFTNSKAFVQTDIVATSNDGDSDGIPDAWEIENTGNTNNYDATSNSDDDDVSDIDEYRAHTNPENPSDYLHIIGMTLTNGSDARLSWSSAEERVYRVQWNDDLMDNDGWTDSSIELPDSNGTTTVFLPESGATQRFVRVRAIMPPAE